MHTLDIDKQRTVLMSVKMRMLDAHVSLFECYPIVSDILEGADQSCYFGYKRRRASPMLAIRDNRLDTYDDEHFR